MADTRMLRVLGIVVLVAIVTAVIVTLLQDAILGESNIAITGGIVGATSAVMAQWARNRRV